MNAQSPTKPAQGAVPAAIRFRGRSFVALVLAPEEPFDDWLARLDALAEKSAGFFLGRPIVLDLKDLPVNRDGLKELVEKLGERGVRIMGVENAKPSQLGPGLPPEMRGGRPANDIDPAQEAERAAAARVAAEKAAAEASVPGAGADAAEAKVAAEAAAKAAADAVAAVQGTVAPASLPSLIIDQPVRSGQSVVFTEGDVTVLGSVASGAEIVAGGSIHVYGALRGRALAGATGNPQARIFCRKLEAELVAIDGLYKTAEDIGAAQRGQAAQVWLEGDAMKIAAIG
ncbi:septum site-determining protein MinC [Salinarimonas ramus]|uniref:Probable septum site-determining protein MinC n=1 Tax=Salinarimonas ramus TaxID=690164 RepID=A0A917Q8Y3_9HYPH|nr:septum site-determining protein MinC [Salinarimonas ramus]GGK36564.1 putative septum site-determining protein MinC [Salinarimonas ramus]